MKVTSYFFGFLAFAAVLVLAISPKEKEQWKLTPSGWAHSSCIHQVRNGAHVKKIENKGSMSFKVMNPDGSEEILQRCQYPIGPAFSPEDQFEGGWQTWSLFENPTSLDSFLGYFTIPDVPKDYSQQTLFMFTGLQNFNWIPGPDAGPAPSDFEIIQPVLQYGPSAAGGGEYWTLASWYVTIDAGFIVSDLLRVTAGDTIFGNMTLIAPDTWFIYGKTLKGGVVTQITVDRPRLVSNPWAYCTLEVYDNSEDCANYPVTPQTYSKLFITSNGKPVIPQWQTNITVSPICNEHTTIESPTHVTIHFGSN